MTDADNITPMIPKRIPDIPLESWIDLQKFVIDPESKQIFQFLNKDIVLSNLNENEIYLVRLIIDYVTELELTKPVNIGETDDIDTGSHFWLSKTLSILHTARSRGGFQQKMFGTSVTKIQRLEEKKKEPWRPWMKEKKEGG
jgi:hypothetical protein